MDELVEERWEQAFEGVRSLQRGLEVLIAVNEAPPARLASIVRQTRLPKATVVRLLSTLAASGYLRQDPDTQIYYPLPKARRLASAMMVENPFLAAARRCLVEFGHVTKWPAEVLMAESDAMVILASNSDTAPIGLKRFEQRRFPMLDSASGLAFLAACPPAAQRSIINRICSLDFGGERAGAVAERAFATLGKVAARGYAAREYQAPTTGLEVFAVPIFAAGEAIGALALFTLNEVVGEARFIERHLPQLTAKAAEIGEQHLIHGARPALSALG